jgi:hypothetical protein
VYDTAVSFRLLGGQAGFSIVDCSEGEWLAASIPSCHILLAYLVFILINGSSLVVVSGHFS